MKCCQTQVDPSRRQKGTRHSEGLLPGSALSSRIILHGRRSAVISKSEQFSRRVVHRVIGRLNATAVTACRLAGDISPRRLCNLQSSASAEVRCSVGVRRLDLNFVEDRPPRKRDRQRHLVTRLQTLGLLRGKHNGTKSEFEFHDPSFLASTFAHSGVWSR